MMALLRIAVGWAARHFFMFLAIVAALIVVGKIYEAYQALPALKGELEALETQEGLLQEGVAREVEKAGGAVERLDQMELQALHQRLGVVRAELAASRPKQMSRTGAAVNIARGQTQAVASQLTAAFRYEILQREEAAILARIQMLQGQSRTADFEEYLRSLDARAAALTRRIDQIERQNPILSRAENIPVLQDLQGPWQELSSRREELANVQQRRQQAQRAHQLTRARYLRAAAQYQERRAAILKTVPPGNEIRTAIKEKRATVSQHWAQRAWEAAKPMLGWAVWILFLVIAVPPAIKAFWFFIIAPLAARLPPVAIRPDLSNDVDWLISAASEGRGTRSGSGVSRRVAIAPGQELLIKPEYLQSSMSEARIDTAAVLSWSLPIGSVAAGMFGLTRIRVQETQIVTVSATSDMFDEVGIIYIGEGSGLVFRPSNLIGAVQSEKRPLRIHSVWRFGHLSAWLTLQFRFLVFEGPCSLIVKGARGVALEPVQDGRRIGGAATMGWTSGVHYSVMRSETFLAYLAGKQSLFNDSFAGAGGKIIYEEMPRARKSGMFGRGLEGLGDGLLKVVGL